MQSSLKIRKGSRNMKYKKITQEQRNQIIQELTKNGKTLKEVNLVSIANQVSESTGLKPSTVKAILQVYLKEGRIGKKSTRDRKIKLLNTTVIALIDKSKTSEQDVSNLSFLTSYVKVNQQSSEISHTGQTMTETQQRLDAYSKQLVSQQVRDFLKEKKSEILEHITNPQARSNFLSQLSRIENSDQFVINEMKPEEESEDILTQKIAKHLRSKIRL